jgi:glycosyltransferase involved in cell wall biosynthesis
MGNDMTFQKNTNHSSIATLSIIVPCYNETEAFKTCKDSLNDILKKLKEKNKISSDSFILFVDDGSTDDTWKEIVESSNNNERIKGIKLSKNRGHQIALYAGLTHSDSDITISIDADLQDDILAIEEMINKYNEGCDIVFGVRNSRKHDTLFKRTTANGFYKLLTMLGIDQVENHADFRLMSRRAVNSLLKYNESNLYLRGLVKDLGYKIDYVLYERKSRLAGKTKYPIKKMLSLAATAITSNSIVPLRLITYFGLIVSLFSFIGVLQTFYIKLTGKTVDGWTSLMMSIFFLGGVQLLSIGIIGEYIGKIYIEAKHRPKYFIEDKT